MLTPTRALVAYATLEDVFTLDGDAVVIAGIQAGHLGSDGTGKAVYFAEVGGGRHTGELIPLRDLTAREHIIGGAA